MALNNGARVNVEDIVKARRMLDEADRVFLKGIRSKTQQSLIDGLKRAKKSIGNKYGTGR